MSGKVNGYARIVGPNGIQEYDTFTCAHNQEIVHVRRGASPEECGGICKQCMGLICPKCVAKMKCTPFERKLEEWERRDRSRRSMGL